MQKRLIHAAPLLTIMTLTMHRLHAAISLTVAAGLFVLVGTNQANGQDRNLFDCRPDTSSDGWICESTAPPQAAQSTPADNRYRGTDEQLFEPQPETSTTSQQTSAATASLSPAAAPSYRGNELDWVSRDQLTAEEQAQLPDNCCGAFIEPEGFDVDESGDPSAAATEFETEEGFNRLPDDTIIINGQVQVRQGNRTVRNDQATTISGSSDTVLMQGNVEFREPGVLMRGSSAFIDRQSGDNRVEDAVYVLHEYGAHGSAASIVYSSDSNLLTIVNGEFSRCEPDSNFWQLRADSIVIDQQAGRGYAQGTSLRIRDIPVFYFPFTLTFPLSDQRVSGFLAPSVGSTRDGGFDLQAPYYFNLAPNYDATLSPRLLTDRGLLVNGEARYLADWSMNTLNVSHLSGDQRFETNSSGSPTLESPPQEDRWFIGFEHTGAIGDNLSTYIDYSAVSDYAYFEDFGSAGLNVASRTHLNRQGRVDFSNNLLRARLNVQRTQILDPLLDPRFTETDLNKPFDRLPQLSLSTDLPVLGDLRFSLETELSVFDRDLNEDLLSQEQLQAGALVNGTRINVQPSLSWNLEAPGWFIRPTVKYRYFAYDLKDQGIFSEEDPDIGVGVFSLDTGLIFERSMNLGNGFTQTLEPRLYYLNSDYEDQSTLPLFDTTEVSFSFNQLFRDNRFAGGDRVNDADQLTAAVTTRFLDNNGRERARFSLGQISYFQDRQVTLSNPLQTWVPLYSTVSDSSAYIGEFGYALSESWRIRGDVQWDEEQQEVNEGSFQLNYQSDGGTIFNVGYRYRNQNVLYDPILNLPFLQQSNARSIVPTIDQTDVSAVLPVSSNWRLLARWNYDHANSRNLESFAGVEFSNCCTTVRVIAREWVRPYALFLPNIEPERGVFVQFTLNGLGNIAGGGLSSLLSDTINGFRDQYQP
ncbi:MAG: LPS-assembly protein LptD, partial [Gammaproteobacteria bacterium]|nr:LPS-assembly protein LptD [Gammaproteobacteria bacterium]